MSANRNRSSRGDRSDQGSFASDRSTQPSRSSNRSNYEVGQQVEPEQSPDPRAASTPQDNMSTPRPAPRPSRDSPQSMGQAGQGSRIDSQSPASGQPRSSPNVQTAAQYRAFGQVPVQQSAYTQQPDPLQTTFSRPIVPLNMLLQGFDSEPVAMARQPGPTSAPAQPGGTAQRRGSVQRGGAAQRGRGLQQAGVPTRGGITHQNRTSTSLNPNAAIFHPSITTAQTQAPSIITTAAPNLATTQAQPPVPPPARRCFGHPRPGRCNECWDRNYCNHDGGLWCGWCMWNR